MVLFAAVLVAVVAVAHGGMMQMPSQQQMAMMQQWMQMAQQQQQMQMVPMGNGGCQQGADGSMPAGCEIPMGTGDVEEYLEQQMKQQQYETQQMAEQIKAQFEAMVREVTAKKHRFVMSLVAEFVATCECARSSDVIYQGLFIQQARALNLTDGMDIWDYNRPPYEAVNEEDARGLIFAGLFRSMCESAASFLSFAEQVENRIPAFGGKKK